MFRRDFFKWLASIVTFGWANAREVPIPESVPEYNRDRNSRRTVLIRCRKGPPDMYLDGAPMADMGCLLQHTSRVDGYLSWFAPGKEGVIVSREWVIIKREWCGAPIPVHMYDWSCSGGYTDDPRIPFLGYGDAAPDIFFGGMAMNELSKTYKRWQITRCQSGFNGFIETIAYDNKGQIVIDHKRGEIARIIHRGLVEVVPKPLPGISGDDLIETTTIHNVNFKTFQPKHKVVECDVAIVGFSVDELGRRWPVYEKVT